MKRLIVPVLSLMMLTSTAAFAGDHGHHGDKGHHGKFENKVEFLTQKLDLTEEQQTQLKSLQEEYMPEKGDIRAKMKAVREEMEALDVNAKDYDKRLNELADAVAADAGTQAKNRILFSGKMKAVLTQEQRDELAKMMEKRGDRKGSKDHHKK